MRHIVIAVAVGIASIQAVTIQIAHAAPPVTKPLPKGWNQPSLLRAHKEMLYSGPYGMLVVQFDPAKGQLRSVQGDFSGSASFTVKLIGAAGGDYAFTTSCYGYDQTSQVFVNMTATGSGKATAEPSQTLSASATGSGFFEAAAATKIFAGAGTIGMHMTCDGPKFSKGGNLFTPESWSTQSFGGSVTYTYLPALPRGIYRPK